MCEENVNIHLCQGTAVRRQDKEYHSSFTSVEDLFAGEFKQFQGCAKTLGRDLQIPTKEDSDSTAGVLIMTTGYERADFRVDTLSLWRKHLAFGPMFYTQKYRLKPTLL